MVDTSPASGRTATSAWGRRFVPAPPSAIFDLLADPSRHPEIDGSGSVQRVLRGPKRLALGSRFAMSMRIGVPYRMTNVVVAFEEDRKIAWRHFGRHVWTYELEPVEGGTVVTESVDWSQVPVTSIFQKLQADRNLRSIEATLDRLAQRFS